MSRKEYAEKILEIVDKTDDVWILEQIYRCVVNITMDNRKDEE